MFELNAPPSKIEECKTNYPIFYRRCLDDSNEPSANTRIHLTKRVDKNKFQYVGVLSGTVSGSKDMAPSIDLKGNIYFTSLRTYDKDMHSLYVGRFDGSSVGEVRPLPGSVSPTVPCWINMDCCVSEDGNSLDLPTASGVCRVVCC